MGTDNPVEVDEPKTVEDYHCEDQAQLAEDIRSLDGYAGALPTGLWPADDIRSNALTAQSLGIIAAWLRIRSRLQDQNGHYGR